MNQSLRIFQRRFYSAMKRLALPETVVTVEEKKTREGDSAEKSEKRETDQYGESGDAEKSTVFKEMFRTYKRRQPRPNMDAVIDTRVNNLERGVKWRSLGLKDDVISPSDIDFLGLIPPSEWNLTTIDGREGLYILPQLLREDSHLEWLSRTFQYAEPPNTTNLTAHGKSPESDVLSAAGKSLRWTTLGVEYDWNTKEYPKEGRELPRELVVLAEVISKVLGLGPMKADAVIVNYYPPKATLSPHQDRSERDLSRPLISLSIGQSAIYLTGGTSLNDPVDPIWLRSGDVLVMHADQRLVYHGVPSIHKTRDFAPIDTKYATNLVEYANTSRVNITIRQVNFDEEEKKC